jgi:hypothetical protein
MTHPQKAESPLKTLPLRDIWESRFKSAGKRSSYGDSCRDYGVFEPIDRMRMPRG